jgi:hypothetical protein
MHPLSYVLRKLSNRTQIGGITVYYENGQNPANMMVLANTLKSYSRTRTLRFIQRYAGGIAVTDRWICAGQPRFDLIFLSFSRHREPHEIIFLLFQWSFFHRWKKYRRGIFCWRCSRRRITDAMARQAERFVAWDFSTANGFSTQGDQNKRNK